MRTKRTIIITACIVLAAAIAGFTLFRRGKSDAPEYQVQAAAQGDIETIVATSGTIDPVETIEIGSEVSGKIIKLYADYNSQVKAGQVVAELDQDVLRRKVASAEASLQSSLAALEKAKVDLLLAQKKLERRRELFKRQEISDEDMESAEADSVLAQAAVRSAESAAAQAKSSLTSSRVDLSHAVIRSPIDGLVLERSVNLGQTVASGYQVPVLFKVADLAHMQVQCSVDEADIGRIKEGQAGRFAVDALPDETFSGIVKQVRNAAVVSSNVVTYTVVIDVANPERRLMPGMTATVSIVVAEAKNVLQVPTTALRFTPAQAPAEEAAWVAGERRKLKAGSAIVWTVDTLGALKPAAVQTGIAGASTTEIVGGDVKAGTNVVIGLKTATTAGTTFGPGMPPPMMMMGGPPPPPPPAR